MSLKENSATFEELLGSTAELLELLLDQLLLDQLLLDTTAELLELLLDQLLLDTTAELELCSLELLLDQLLLDTTAEFELGSTIELELGLLDSLELLPSQLLELDLPELESPSPSPSLEHANSIKATRDESMIFLVIILPRNIVSEHFAMLRTLASFPASVFDRHGSGTVLEFHKVALKGYY